MLRQEGVQQWIATEIADLGKIKFLYKNKETPISKVSWLSEKM
jgi:hypothetical protein